MNLEERPNYNHSIADPHSPSAPPLSVEEIILGDVSEEGSLKTRVEALEQEMMDGVSEGLLPKRIAALENLVSEDDNEEAQTSV